MSTTTDRDRPGEPDADAEHGRSESESDPESESCSSSSGPPLYGASTARSFRCPCCLSLTADSDYHHWLYENWDGVDVGLHLCRECHTAVHGDQRVAVQRRRSHTSDWKDDALARLIARHRAIWGRSPSRGFRRWYNIPVSRGRVLRAIPKSLDPAVLDAAVPDDPALGRDPDQEQLVETETDQAETAGADADADGRIPHPPMKPDP